ncbi:peroxidase family protein [Crateriforma spongiae]|uniref:peroxidase family protein n=1 Tax=Crateriforma spongiae TaxID=2724528 RepID=UPI0014471F82|nr:peroxidase family protein [Crateriforma spongiae]
MSDLWNRWIRRLRPNTNVPRRRKTRRRKMRSEALESRRLLAANLFHNQAIPEDVNEDGQVTAIDALTIINQMNRRQSSADADNEPRGRGRMTDVNNDGRDTAHDALLVINRLNRERNQSRPDRDDQAPVADPPTETPDEDPLTTTEVQSIDGTGNNLENPDLGAADTELLRVSEADYADGISQPAGEDRPSAREISNTLSAADPEGTTSDRDLSSFVFAWGQFLDHDIDLSLEPETDGTAFDIQVPTGDPLFDPLGTGEATIHLTRSEFADGTGTSTENPAEQVNAITAWIDGSQIYGSDQTTADSLREFVGGRLLITDDGLLPSDENGGILAGDIRAAENIMLTSMHALFVREHNRLADEISASDPTLTDEQIYQEARATVIAELQSITYNEFLPALLGNDAVDQYVGYNADVDPSIANEFSTAAFRFGHSTLNDTFRMVGDDGSDIDEAISLADAFFQPGVLKETGIEPLLKYASSTLSQEVDLEVVDSLRNFLFGPPGAGGLDLVSLNIQRGRDHGLADYNSVRQAYGLEPVDTFDAITSDSVLAANLESLYGSVDNIDLWVGLLAEDATEDGSLGETATTIIADQFERLRDGDRFWYQNTLSGRELREVENTTLADIIDRNTELTTLQENVFFFAPEISGTVMAESTSRDVTSQSTDPLQAVVDESEPISEADLELLARDQGNDRRQNDDRKDRRKETDGDLDPMAGATLQLLDSDGNVVDVAITDDRGNYSFAEIDQSGTYTIQMLPSDLYSVIGNETLQVQVTDGDVDIRDMDFRVVV